MDAFILGFFYNYYMRILNLLLTFTVLSFLSFACVKSPSTDSTAELTIDERIAPYPELNYQELAALIKDNALTLVDANSEKVYESGHIPRAISFFKLADDFAAHLPKDKNALVVSYCANPQCLSWLMAAEKASELGYTNVKHFAGGLQGWKKAGGKLL